MNDERNPIVPGGAPEGPHAPPRGARTMNLVRIGLLAALAIVAVASVGGFLMARRGTQSAQTAEAKYHCPMHPTYTSERPGSCPICGMDLEPIPAAGAAAGGGAMAGDVPGLTGIHIEPERIQRIGVRTAVAERRPLGASLDLVAFVAPDEARMRQIQLRVAGWVKELNVSRIGETVRAGQPLLSIYSPELFQSEKEFLIELEAAEAGATAGLHHEAEAVRAGRSRLSLLGVPDEEVARLERERRAETQLTLRAPVSGTVLERGVTEGQYVGPGTPLLTLADLSAVWLLMDLYEMDLARVRVRDAATFVSDALPGRTFEGRVDFIYPTVTPETRTVKARIVLANRSGELKPGMYGRVRLAPRGAAVLSVPAEAVIHTGDHDYVFLMHADGHFEPRMVWVGGTDGERIEIRRGIAAGDTVVASASFLIDSESRLRAAISGSAGGAAAGAHQH
jgi:Cu(I)/Ag(I) efflux system membrane fusion protein